MTKPSKKTCIFCRQTGKLTKEHLWGDWLRQHIPRDSTHNLHFVTERERPAQKGRLHGPGDPHSRRLLVVCNECNNGWMSALQTAAKPWLGPLARGDWLPLEYDAQCALAAWATMFAMVVEFAHPPTVVIPQAERTGFKVTRATPPGWLIFLGRYDDPHGRDGAFNHHAGVHFGIYDHPRSAFFYEEQSCGFIVGKVMFQVWSCTPINRRAQNNRHDEYKEAYPELSLIYPPQEPIRVPPPPMTYEQFDMISNDIAIREGIPFMRYIFTQ
jgi:hypothetical protein